MQNIELNVEGMRCSGCEMRVKNVLSKVVGVHTVKADFKAKKVYVVTEDSVIISDIKEKIEDLGFEVVQK